MAENAFDKSCITRMATLLGEACETLGESAGSLGDWQARVNSLGNLNGETLKVAVAGTVKSGKTTLVNSLMGDDLLKRGAGIVTSVVTKLRGGSDLHAKITLKGWKEVNLEAADAALFMGYAAKEGELDLRDDSVRRDIRGLIDKAGSGALGENGTFEKHITLLGAMLDGYERVKPLLGEDVSTIEFDGDRFAEHKDYASSDALAVYVDDLTLDIPGFPLPKDSEIADCQGYDSPNPRHREKVQQYLLDCHLVVYVVSSRVGLRDADLRFLRDIERMGLMESSIFVLNVDLSEHEELSEIDKSRQRLETELRPFGEKHTIYTLSALRALLRSLRAKEGNLTRKEKLLLELWEEDSPLSSGGFEDFNTILGTRLGKERDGELERLARTTLERGRDALETRIKNLISIAERRTGTLDDGLENLQGAHEIISRSVDSFEAALTARAEAIRKEAFEQVNKQFHPGSGVVAEEVASYVRTMKPSMEGLGGGDSKKLFQKLAGVQQMMREEFQRYKIDTVNPMAVEAIRVIWGDVTDQMERAAHDAASLVIEAVEGYRSLAMDLGIEVGDLDLPEMEGLIGKKTIPLFSAVTVPAQEASAQQVVSFATHWSLKIATGWASRLISRGGKSEGDEVVNKGAATARELLADEARSALLHYNEHVKYQLVGKNLAELLQSWINTYRDTLDALLEEIEHLIDDIRSSREGAVEQVPQLRKILLEVNGLCG